MILHPKLAALLAQQVIFHRSAFDFERSHFQAPVAALPTYSVRRRPGKIVLEHQLKPRRQILRRAIVDINARRHVKCAALMIRITAEFFDQIAFDPIEFFIARA